jgi:DNA-binding beta-propeller fold protein YncE
MFTVRRTITALAVVLPVAGFASPAHADSTTSLPLTSFSSLAVDSGHHHVFASGGTADDAVAVLNLKGQVSTVLHDLPGAADMVLSGDRSTLYVALSEADAVAAIDTKSLKETARYSTGTTTCPTHLARVGDILWFGYGCQTGEGQLGSLAVTNGEPVVTLGQEGPYTLEEPPVLAARPDAPDGPLITGEPGLSPGIVREYRLDGNTAVLEHLTAAAGSDVADVAVTPDGSRALVALGYPYHVTALSTTDLSEVATYETGSYPNAVEVSPDGASVATGIGDSSHANDVAVFPAADGTTPTRGWDFGVDPSSSLKLVPRALVWGSGGRLYAVSENVYGENPTLHVLNTQ